MSDQEWRARINMLIRQTEVNLSLVDGRPPSSWSQSPAHLSSSPQLPPSFPSPPHPANFSMVQHDLSPITRHTSSMFDASVTTAFSESLVGNGQGQGRTHTPPLLPPPPARRAHEHHEHHRENRRSPEDLHVELRLLKHQFLLFKENAEKTSQAQMGTISTQHARIEDLKHEVLLKSQVEEELISRVKKAVREEVMEEVLQLKSRVQNMEVGFSNAGELAATHTSPIHARMEQLSHTVHTTVGQLRNEMGRVRATMDSFMGNATQAQSLSSSVEMGGIRSIVTDWNLVIGGLKSELEALKGTMDRISGINTVGGVRNELHVLRDAVDRNSGWQSAVGVLHGEVDTLRDTFERTVGHMRGELGVLQAKADRPSQQFRHNFPPHPFAQEFIHEYVLDRPVSRSLRLDSDARTKGRRGRAKSSSDSSSDASKMGKRSVPKHSHTTKSKKDKGSLEGSDSRRHVTSGNGANENLHSRRDVEHESTVLHGSPLTSGYVPVSNSRVTSDRLNLMNEAGYDWRHSPSSRDVHTPVSLPSHNSRRSDAPIPIRGSSKTPPQDEWIDGKNAGQLTLKEGKELVKKQRSTELNNQRYEDQVPGQEYGNKSIDGDIINQLVISNKSSGELGDLFQYKRTTEDKEAQLLEGSETDNNKEGIYDKADTEVIYDKTDTEVVYDKTDTDLHMASELAFDGTDTEAELETDNSFHNDRLADGMRTRASGDGHSHNSPLNNRSTRSSGNYSDFYQSPDAAKTTSRGVDTDLEYSMRGARARIGARDSAETDDSLSKDGRVRVKPKRLSVGYETDEIGQTEIRESAAESEKSRQFTRYPESEVAASRDMVASAGHESDEVRTEDDFSFGSFDGNSADENLDAVGGSNNFHGSSDGDHSSSSYITAEPAADPSLEELHINRFGKDDDASSDASARRSTKLFTKFISKKVKSCSKIDGRDRDDLSSSSADTDSSLMDSWNKAMGIPSTTLPPSLLKASRNSPISARKMYSEDEELGGNALTKAGSFMTYEQFSSQFTDKERQNNDVEGGSPQLNNHESPSFLEDEHGDPSELSYDEDPLPSQPNNVENHRDSFPSDIRQDIDHASPDTVSAYKNINQITLPTTTSTATTATTPDTISTASSQNPKKYKRSVSSKIMDLQKECGFFRTPPPSLSTAVPNGESLPSPPASFVHVPIPSPVRSRSRGPPRRPPALTKR